MPRSHVRLLTVFVTLGLLPEGLSSDACSASDARLRYNQAVICKSFGEPCGGENVTSQTDWPNQAIYMHIMLNDLANSSTCLDTTVAKSIVAWMDVTSPKVSAWWWTWLTFQPQYYDMPRKPGSRIESPATLGRKCFAFAYLRQIWSPLRPELERALAVAGLDLRAFIDAYDRAVPFTMALCRRVTANCYVNASYDPAARNGTCPQRVKEFVVGFEWENLGGGRGPQPLERVVYPFPAYDQTEAFRDGVSLAVSTALNYIV